MTTETKQQQSGAHVRSSEMVRPQEDVKYIIQEHSCNDWYDCPDTEEYEYEADAVMEATLLAGSSTAYKYRVVRRSESVIWKDRVVA